MLHPTVQVKHAKTAPAKQPSAQAFKNGEIHQWYRLTLGFSDHLVADLLEQLEVKPGQKVLDPFSGSGTTAVECKKKGIDCWAVDANPTACYATTTKTRWKVDPIDFTKSAIEVAAAFKAMRHKAKSLKLDQTFTYIKEQGMIQRGWISEKRLLDVIALKHVIVEKIRPSHKRDLLILAVMNELVHTASNVRFGPELYCGKQRTAPILKAFLNKVAQIADDLTKTISCPKSKTQVCAGDSRSLNPSWVVPPKGGFDAIITSPPYPTEHDYTRNGRLELAFLESVRCRETLRIIKKNMIRSHTKGIYSTDDDAKEVSRFQKLRQLVKRIEAKASHKEHGFARLYGTVTMEYFGGMRRHFRAVRKLLKNNALCAYVVGDQSSYLQVKIPTAKILSQIASREGFSVVEIKKWRERWSSTSKKFLKENILLLKSKPK